MPGEPSPRFQPTRWSLVQRAQGISPEGRKALAELCEAYWTPVFRVLRGLRRNDDEARERCQAFFAYLLEGGRLSGADPRRGRFRSFLLGALRHFEARQWEHERRQKRGGAAVVVSLEEQDADPAVLPDQRRFDREWALAVVARAVSAVERDYASSGREGLFTALKETLTGADAPQEAAVQLGLTEGALKVAVHRLRRRFREAVRLEIADTLPADASVEDEMGYLVQVLAQE